MNRPHWIPIVTWIWVVPVPSGLSNSRMKSRRATQTPAPAMTVPSPPGRSNVAPRARRTSRAMTPSATSSTAASMNEKTSKGARLSLRARIWPSTTPVVRSSYQGRNIVTNRAAAAPAASRWVSSSRSSTAHASSSPSAARRRSTSSATCGGDAGVLGQLLRLLERPARTPRAIRGIAGVLEHVVRAQQQRADAIAG